MNWGEVSMGDWIHASMFSSATVMLVYNRVLGFSVEEVLVIGGVSFLMCVVAVYLLKRWDRD